MRTSALSTQRLFPCAATLLALAALSACGEEAPPYSDLPLRDALNAAPEVLASLPDEALRDIAARLEETQASVGENTAVTGVEIRAPLVIIRSADAQREEEGKDANVLGAIDASPDGFVLRSIAAGSARPDPYDPPAPSGPPPEASALREDAALRGRAGVILADLALRSGANEFIRVTGAPVGAVAFDGAVYVNASWLVAMSALEPPGAMNVITSGAPSLRQIPKREPKSVRANPYNLPASIAACSSDVDAICACAASFICDHTPTDLTFASGQEECAWVNLSPENPQALCVLALMRIDGVRECVQAGGSACAVSSVTSRDEALAFVASAGCLDVLDNCLSRGKPSPGVSTGDGSGSCNGGGCDSCGGSDPNGGGCNQSCNDCNQNCSDCNQNCSDCNQNNQDCNQNNQDCNKNCGGGACKISARGRLIEQPAPAPIGAAFWLLAPVGYILRRSRRRS